MSIVPRDLEKDDIDCPVARKKLYRHTLIIISVSQLFGGAGLAAGIAVGALLAQDMLGTKAWAGIPAALFTLGSALAAYLVGRFTHSYGRRIGLAAGFLAGGIGAVGVVIAAMINSIVLLFISLFVYGAGTATNLQSRYATTDLAEKHQRATAISIAMVSATLGAFAGPNLVDLMGKFAESIHIPKLAGAFILSASAYILAGLIIFLFLRPDPYFIAQALKQKGGTSDESINDGNETYRKGIVVGSTIMILTQIVMIAIMTMTPVHMKHHGHDLNAIGLVIGVHIGSMYLPSIVTGILVDKIGRKRMAVASGFTLLSAGLLAATAPTDSSTLLIVALALLGLGWNFGLISGTALVVDSTQSSTRAKTQGAVDVLIAVSGASGGAFSGMIVSSSSYAALSLSGGILSLLLIPVIIWANRPIKTSAAHKISAAQ